MECKAVQDNLSAYIDRELAPEAERSIGAHLSVCEQCTAQHTKLLKAWETLEVWEDVSPPDRLRRKILASAMPKNNAASVRRVLSVAAVLLLVLGIAVYYSGQKGRSVQDVSGSQSAVQAVVAGPISEDEIIANLLILEEKDFFDALDELVKIDDLPFDEESFNRRKGHERSPMEQVIT